MFSIAKLLANCSAGLFVVLVLLASCADTADVCTLEPGESIVFGKVNVAQYGELVTDLDEPKGGIYRLILSRPNMATADEIILPDDGRFTWALEPGDYLLAAFYWIDASLWGNKSSTPRLPARVVVCKQGLKTPHYEIDQPLRPDTKYLWSVRFRDGDTVSVWSSTGRSNFAFHVIAFSWGKVRGELFAFRTPLIDGAQRDWLNR